MVALLCIRMNSVKGVEKMIVNSVPVIDFVYCIIIEIVENLL